MSPKVELVPATGAHVGPIANRMRAEDRLECSAMGSTPKRSLRMGLLTSADVWTAKVDGSAHAMFGLVVRSALSGIGTPWFLGTDEVYRHPKLMLRMGLVIVDRWCCACPDLSNFVAAGNIRAIRLLRFWGFLVSDEALFFGGVEFRRFSLSHDSNYSPP